MTARGTVIFVGKNEETWWVDPPTGGDSLRETGMMHAVNKVGNRSDLKFGIPSTVELNFR
jgi:hypothetical protein